MGTRRRGIVLGERPDRPEPPGEIVTVDQASMRYDGEWVLMLVTGLDEAERVPRGHVLHHSKSRREISHRIKQLHDEDPSAHFLLTLGGTRRLRPGDFGEAPPPLSPRSNVNAR